MKFETESKIVAAVQGWLDRNWRTGAGWNYRTKAALCEAIDSSMRGLTDSGRDIGTVRVASAALRDLEDIRHTKAHCTARFTARLTRFVGDLNAELERLGPDTPRVTIPLRGMTAQADNTVKVPAEFADRDRTLVPLNRNTVEIDRLGETVLSITITSSKMTVNLTQKPAE